MKVDPVRRRAVEILAEVNAGAGLEVLLDRALAAFDRRSGRFLVEIVKGSLRWQGRYDFLVRRFSRRRFPENPNLLAILRSALHQLIACAGVPDYAVLHQAGELCRVLVNERAVSYVNGLLQAARKALAAGGGQGALGVLSLFPSPVDDSAAFLAAWHSHPRWLIERWLARFGLAGCEALCRFNNQPPPLNLHVLAPAEPEAIRLGLQAEGLAAVPGRWHERALQLTDRLGRERLGDLLQRRRDLIVQDEGAQFVTAWLAAGGAGRLLDLCAGPGGKTFHLRAIWPDPADIVAMDIGRERLAPLRETAKRIEADDLGMVLADGNAPPFGPDRFAAVLLDGPCCGTGVLRHHPEGRWRLQEGALARSGDRLLALARHAVDLLAEGGRLLFVTCSLEPEENQEVVAALLAADPRLEPDPRPGAGVLRPGAGATGESGHWLELLPQHTGTDGFFAASLRRKGPTS